MKLSKKFFVYADRLLSPFEGSPRASAAEYVERGDVNNNKNFFWTAPLSN